MTSATPSTIRVAVAATAGARLRGLLGCPALRPGCGLLLPGESRVHGIGMRHALDVVFLDRGLRIVGLAALPPGRLRGCRGATAVLELRAGEIARLGLSIGDRPALRLSGPLAALLETRPGGRRMSRRPLAGLLRASLVAGCLILPAPTPSSAQAPAGPDGRLQDRLPQDPRRHPGSALAVPEPSLPGSAVPGGLLAGLLRASETRYRQGGHDAALADFRFIAEASPALAARAWLRVGNIHQRRGETDAAIAAYRRSADAASVRADAGAGTGEDAEVRGKALGNLALLALDVAAAALSTLAPRDAADPLVAEAGARIEQLAGTLPRPSPGRLPVVRPPATGMPAPVRGQGAGMPGAAPAPPADLPRIDYLGGRAPGRPR